MSGVVGDIKRQYGATMWIDARCNNQWPSSSVRHSFLLSGRIVRDWNVRQVCGCVILQVCHLLSIVGHCFHTLTREESSLAGCAGGGLVWLSSCCQAVGCRPVCCRVREWSSVWRLLGRALHGPPLRVEHEMRWTVIGVLMWWLCRCVVLMRLGLSAWCRCR